MSRNNVAGDPTGNRLLVLNDTRGFVPNEQSSNDNSEDESEEEYKGTTSWIVDFETHDSRR